MAKETKADTTFHGALLGFSSGNSPVKSVQAKVGEKPNGGVNGGDNGGDNGGTAPQGGEI